MNQTRVTGIETAQKRLAEAMQDIEIASEEMLAVMLQSISANTMPYVPVDNAYLINSEYRRTGDGPDGPWGVIGYGSPTAASKAGGTPVQEYAVYVHEGKQKNWQKPGASNKYLSKGIRDFQQDDLSRIIAAYQS